MTNIKQLKEEIEKEIEEEKMYRLKGEELKLLQAKLSIIKLWEEDKKQEIEFLKKLLEPLSETQRYSMIFSKVERLNQLKEGK